jgi:hypothetical protein
LLDQALVALGDVEMSLPVEVAVLVGEEARRRGKKLRLLERFNVREVEVALGAAKAPCRRVVCAGGEFRRVEDAEREPHPGRA